MVDFDMDAVNKLPKWAIPVGVGGIAGVFVLMRKKPTPQSAPIVVGGQTPGGTTGSTEQLGNQMMKMITDMFTAQGVAQDEREEAEREQEASFLENFVSLQSGNASNIASLIASQNGVIATNNSAIMGVITAWSESIAEQLEAISEREVQTGPVQVITLIDQFRTRFTTAFARMGKPFGTMVPNSDITTGSLGASAPYASDRDFTYYDTTGHMVTGPFRQFLGNFGGARTYGRPLSQVFRDSDGFDTQVFENAIMKYIPNSNPGKYDITVLQMV